MSQFQCHVIFNAIELYLVYYVGSVAFLMHTESLLPDWVLYTYSVKVMDIEVWRGEMEDCYYKVIQLPHLSSTLYPVPLFLCSPTDVNALSQPFQGQLSCETAEAKKLKPDENKTEIDLLDLYDDDGNPLDETADLTTPDYSIMETQETQDFDTSTPM